MPNQHSSSLYAGAGMLIRRCKEIKALGIFEKKTKKQSTLFELKSKPKSSIKTFSKMNALFLEPKLGNMILNYEQKYQLEHR